MLHGPYKRKVILGWLIDTVAMTISLPIHRQQRLLELLQGTLKLKKLSVWIYKSYWVSYEVWLLLYQAVMVVFLSSNKH